MAKKEDVIIEPIDELTSVTPIVHKKDNIPRVPVYIPNREEDSDKNVKIDPYEHVTINGVTTLVKRGVHVEVPVPVYIQLKNKFPGI